MTQRNLRVLVLYDLPENVADHTSLTYLLENEDRPTERDVVKAMLHLGHKVQIYGVYDNVKNLWQTLEDLNPDIIFNLCETFQGRRNHEGDIASILALSQIPFTGCHPAALHLCKDKAVTKKIAASQGIPVPKFEVYRQKNFVPVPFSGKFPLIVKPLDLEASEGISQQSIVQNWTTCFDRVTWLLERFKTDAIVEEFIHGREIYIGLIQTEGQLIALPPRELKITQKKPSDPLIATYKAKWDDTYREKWGIQTCHAADLPAETEHKLKIFSQELFRQFNLNGYARIDWRLDENLEPVFLEVNPNPALSQDDELALAAKNQGIKYTELIVGIIDSALNASRYHYENHAKNQTSPRWSATTLPITSKERSSA